MSGKRQYEVLDAIKTFVQKNGYAPTMRQICEATGIKSTSHASCCVDKLHDEGLIVRGPKNSKRSIHLTGEEYSSVVQQPVGECRRAHIDTNAKKSTTNPIAVRLNDTDKAALRTVADYLQRSQAETIRILVRSAEIVLKTGQ